jgi:hypothetical protein
MIDSIMPLVKDSDSSAPFIIYKIDGDTNGPWFVSYPYPSDNIQSAFDKIRKGDPCAVMFTGYEFSRGSFSYVFDKVLSCRLRAEFDATDPDAANRDELRAVVNFMEDYICDFSATTTEYLMQNNRPLAMLADMLLVDLKSDFFSYNESKTQEAVEFIEHQIGKEKSHTAQKPKPQAAKPQTLLGEVRDAAEIVEQRKAERGNTPAIKKRDDLEV